MKDYQENHYKRWTDGERARLVRIFTDYPFHLERVAYLAGRSPASVATRLAEWGYITDELAELYYRTHEQIEAMPYPFQDEADRRYVAMYLADPLAFLKRDRLDIWIAVIERVKARGGRYTAKAWQSLPEEQRALITEDELIEVNGAANLGGWLAVSPEWQEFGLVANNGAPYLRQGEGEEYGMAQWLNVPHQVAGALVGVWVGAYHDTVDLSTLEKALEALYRMKETGNPGV